MKYLLRVMSILLICCFSVMGTIAQDDAEPNVIVLNCTEGEGCVRTESEINQSEAEVLFGESAPNTETPTVVCADGLGCQWSRISDREVDLLFDGDGVDDLVFDEDEGLEVIIEDEDTMDSEGEEDDLIFTEDEVEEYRNVLCDGDADCDFTLLSPEEIDAIFPEFEGVAYLITPREGTWQGVSYPPVLSGCPAQVAESLAGYTISDTGTFSVTEPFDISSLMFIPDATVTNPVPNIYSIVYSPDPTVVVRYIYRIVSPEYIQINLLFAINVPGVMSCSVTVDFEMTYLGE